MIERSFIWIDGPAGAGKTTLIGHVLRGNRSALVSSLRLVEGPCSQSAAAGDDEAEAYREAGAFDVARIEVPPGDQDAIHDLVWDSAPLHGYCDAVIVEGTIAPRFGADLVVWVTPPPAGDEPLVRREVREVARLDGCGLVAQAIGAPEGSVRLVEEDEVGEWDAEEGETICEIPDEVGLALIRLLREGMPVRQERWHLRPDQARLAHAGIVVINVRSAPERAGAERFARAIHRLREDDNVRRDVLGHSVSRRPITVVVADLADLRDAGTRQAVARVRRAWSTRRR